MKKIFFFLITFSIIYGFVVIVPKIFPFYLNDLISYNSEIDNQNDNKSLLKKCEIQKIDFIPTGSIAIVGHAYGSPFNSDDDSFISYKITNFLNDNATHLSKVIFTGDLFKKPTLNKWVQLNNIYKNKFDIYIAPGNHDFYNPISRIYFLLSPFGFSKFPKIINYEKKQIIVEDSITNRWVVDKTTIDLINNFDNDEIIVARHNVPVKEIINFSNSKEGVSDNLDSFISLQNKIPSKNVLWLIGDGDSFDCFYKKNHRFIINGIFDKIDDTIIILYKDKIFSFFLSN